MKSPTPMAISELAELFARLPGIGSRTSRRLVYHLLQADPEYCLALGEVIRQLRQRVRNCSSCGNYTEEDPCALCTDPRRDDRLLCVVTSAADLMALERTGTFRGRYHVLGGLLAPLDGVGPEELRLAELLDRLGTIEGLEELILATPPSVEGEATASYIADLARDRVAKITRIASGVPHGGELEFSDPVTLGHALDGRRNVR